MIARQCGVKTLSRVCRFLHLFVPFCNDLSQDVCGSVPLGSGKLSPLTGCMEDFNEKKQKNEVWFSDPVYSHFGGYKMCLKVVS